MRRRPKPKVVNLIDCAEDDSTPLDADDIKAMYMQCVDPIQLLSEDEIIKHRHRKRA